MLQAALFRLQILALLLLASNVHAAGVPDDCTQLLVGVAPDSNSMRGELRQYERVRGGKWTQQGAAIPVLFGKNGVAWGSGLAGVFRIGKIYTYDAKLPGGSNYPFHQVTAADAWIDDPASPDYNRFITIPDPENPPAWFEKQKMRHNDFAYRWLVEIRHNSDPPVPGEGSAIFFHIRRGATRPTAGCTTMAEQDLGRVISWFKSASRPCYALLPAAEYEKKWQPWNLPAPVPSSGAKE